jgi:hypothetical protein
MCRPTRKLNQLDFAGKEKFIEHRKGIQIIPILI